MLNQDEFSRLAAKYIDTVFRIAYGYLKNHSDADDVTQNVMLKLCETDKDFSSDEHVKSWLIRVTINQCKNVFRLPWRNSEQIGDYAESLSSGDNTYSELFSAVMGLDAKYRVTLLLYYYEGYSIREIAAIMGAPEKTVSTRLIRARAILKKLLTEE